MDEGNRQFTGVFNEVQQARFKPFVRIIAFFIIACFLYQDVAYASGPDLLSRLGASYRIPTTTSQHPLNFGRLFSPERLYAQQAIKNDESSSPSSSQSQASSQPSSNSGGYSDSIAEFRNLQAGGVSGAGAMPSSSPRVGTAGARPGTYDVPTARTYNVPGGRGTTGVVGSVASAVGTAAKGYAATVVGMWDGVARAVTPKPGITGYSSGVMPKLESSRTAAGTVTRLPGATAYGRDGSTHPELDSTLQTGTVQVGGATYIWNKDKEGSFYRGTVSAARSVADNLGIAKDSPIRSVSQAVFDKVTTVGSLYVAQTSPTAAGSLVQSGAFGDWTLKSGSQVTLEARSPVNGNINFVGLSINAPRVQNDGSLRFVNPQGRATLEPYRVVDRMSGWRGSSGAPWQSAECFRGQINNPENTYQLQKADAHMGGFAGFKGQWWNPHVMDMSKTASYDARSQAWKLAGDGWKQSLIIRPSEIKGIDVVAGKLTIDLNNPSVRNFNIAPYQQLTAQPFQQVGHSLIAPTLERKDLAIGTVGFGSTFEFARNVGFTVDNKAFTGSVFAGTDLKSTNKAHWAAVAQGQFFQSVDKLGQISPTSPFSQKTAFGTFATSAMTNDLREGFAKISANKGQDQPGCGPNGCPPPQPIKFTGGWDLDTNLQGKFQGQQGQLVFMKESTYDFGSTKSLSSPWQLNTNGLGTSFQNVGKQGDSTPLAPYIGIQRLDTIAHLPFQDDKSKYSSGLFLSLDPGHTTVTFKDWKTGTWSKPWSPQAVLNKYNAGAAAMRRDGFNAPKFSMSDFTHVPLYEPKIVNMNVGKDFFMKLPSPSGTAAGMGSDSPRGSFRILGDGFQSAYKVSPNGDGLRLTSDTKYGGLWQISTLSVDGNKFTHTITDGLVSLNRVQSISGLGADLANKGGIINSRGFSLQALKNDPNVVQFKNGFGVNLNHVQIQGGSIVGPGLGKNYLNDQDKLLPGRLVDGFQMRTETSTLQDDFGRTLTTEFNKATVLSETTFTGKAIANFERTGGSIDQTLKGLTRPQLEGWVKTTVGVDLKTLDSKAERIKQIAPDTLKTSIDLTGVKVLPTLQGIKLLTPDSIMFSQSHLLNPSRDSMMQQSTLTNSDLGEGVNLKWISSVAPGSSINIHEGTAGIQLTPTINAQGQKSFNIDFSPIYSAGAVWQKVPLFKTEINGDVKYANRDYGIRYSPDTWIGHIENQQGFLRIGNAGKFYGDAALIKNYASNGPLAFQTLDKSGVLTTGQLNRLDILTTFKTAGVTAGTIAGKSESLLAASTHSNIDWDLSYATGTYKQSLHSTTSASMKVGGDIVDLGITEYSNGNFAPTLVAKGDFLVPEFFNKQDPSVTSPTQGPKITASSVNPVLQLNGQTNGAAIRGNDYWRVNIASGVNGFVFQPEFTDDGRIEIGNLDINSLALSDKAKWTGVQVATKNPDGSLTIQNKDNLLAYATQEAGNGLLIRSNLGINPEAANTNYLSLG